jgi:hypothetical protein
MSEGRRGGEEERCGIVDTRQHLMCACMPVYKTANIITFSEGWMGCFLTL